MKLNLSVEESQLMIGVVRITICLFEWSSSRYGRLTWLLDLFWQVCRYAQGANGSPVKTSAQLLTDTEYRFLSARKRGQTFKKKCVARGFILQKHCNELFYFITLPVSDHCEISIPILARLLVKLMPLVTKFSSKCVPTPSGHWLKEEK